MFYASSLQRGVTVPGLRAGQDLASCARQRYLYVADSGRDAVHRVCSDGVSSVWLLKDKPTALSVTRIAGSESPRTGGNLLVTFSMSQKLREYSPCGKLLRQILLGPDIGIRSYWLRSFSTRSDRSEQSTKMLRSI